MKEISYKDFPLLTKLASYNFFGMQRNAVFKKDSGEYGIRTIKTIGKRSEWEYFKLDETGLITSSPRGMAKEYNKKVRIIDMEMMLKDYESVIINQW